MVFTIFRSKIFKKVKTEGSMKNNEYTHNKIKEVLEKPHEFSDFFMAPLSSLLDPPCLLD